MLVRALNVLRQYDEAGAAEAWAQLREPARRPAGCSSRAPATRLGRRACWVALDASGPLTITFAARVAGLERPSDLAERLPKALIHRNVPGEPVHAFLTAFNRAWAAGAPYAAFGPAAALAGGGRAAGRRTAGRWSAAGPAGGSAR